MLFLFLKKNENINKTEIQLSKFTSKVVILSYLGRAGCIWSRTGWIFLVPLVFIWVLSALWAWLS